MMSVAMLPDQLKPGDAVPEIEALHQLQFLQHSHGTVDGHQVAPDPPERRADLPDSHRAAFLAQRLDNRLPCPGDPPRTMTKLGRKVSQRVLFARMLMTFAGHDKSMRVKQAGRHGNGHTDDNSHEFLDVEPVCLPCFKENGRGDVEKNTDDNGQHFALEARQ
jgi:hypothetical protein